MFAVALCGLLVLLGAHGQPSEVPNPPSEGFLADELPLEIITTTPSAIRKETTVSVSGSQAITAVFTRPVIALGSDFGIEELPFHLVPFTLNPPVEGRGRWVTTYIYRFDTVEPFPTDLSLTFAWNLNLTTYDGVPLSLGESPETVTLTTLGLIMSIFDVVSDKARNLTAGSWSPFSGLDSDILPEVPPDGVIQLDFNAPVSLSILQQELKVVVRPSGEQANIQLSIERCLDDLEAESDELKCANVSYTGNLEIGTKYALMLPAGLDYANASGPLGQDLMKSFGGLRRFRFPFYDYRVSVSSPFLKIFLYHGLAKETSLKDIPLELYDEKTLERLPYELIQVDEATLRLTAAIEPKTKYKMKCGASELVRDGFGLPLESNTLKFEASKIFEDFKTLDTSTFPSYAVFEATEDWGRQILSFSKGREKGDRSRCSTGSVVDIWSIDEPSSPLPAFLGGNSKSFEKFLGPIDAQLVAPRLDDVAELTSLDLTPFLNSSGTVVSQICSYDYFDVNVFVQTTVQAVVVTHDQIGKQHNVTVWLTLMETGEPVQGAEVFLYDEERQNADPLLLGQGYTDDLGLARIETEHKNGDLTCVVKIGSSLMYVPSVIMGNVIGRSITDSLVFDRALVRPGETLHIKGYVWEREGRQWIPAQGLTNTMLEISPGLSSDQDETFPVELNTEFGTYEALIEIPEDADPISYLIQFIADKSDKKTFQGVYESFTVGDPRLPSVQLTVDGPYWVPPTGKIQLSVNIESFIGSAVGGSEIAVEWSISDPEVLFEDEIKGELTIVTDDSGNGNGTINLSEIETPPTLDSFVDVTFQYVGPTSELLEDSLSVRIAAADVSLSILRTVETNIPGQSFGVSVTATDLQGDPLVGNATIEKATISLLPKPDEEQSPGSDANAFVIASCDYTFDDEEFCDFDLPSIGEFLIRACVEQSAVVCEEITAGQKLEDWEDEPLKSFIPIGFTDLTPHVLRLGEEKRILIENPYEIANALISYGTIENVVDNIYSLNKGRTVISLPIDAFCEFGCGLSIFVTVPRQTEGLAMNLTIPVSRFFDPASPHSQYHDDEISVLPSVPIEIPVSIAFPDAEIDEGVAVVAPGEKTIIEVELGTDSKTQVTVIAVDEAVLSLIAYDLVNLSDAFRLDLKTEFDQGASTDFIIAPFAIQALIDLFEERKELTPWFSISNSLNGFFGDDRSIEMYINDESQYITTASFGEIALYNFHSNVATADFGFVSTADFGSASGSGAVFFVSAKSSSVGGESAETTGSFASNANFAASEETFATFGNSNELRLESEFLTTSLFETQVTEDGMLQVSFEAPPNLGTFVVRAYAVSVDGVFGSTESEIIVRRKVSLTPSLPRFARTGDIFDAGAVVTVSGAKNVSVKVEVAVEGPLEIIGDDVLTVNVGGDGQEAARFTFRALEVGVANLTLIAVDDKGNSDALKLELEIEGLQESVTVGTSFTVEGEAVASFVEGIDLPNAVPGSGNILITAGVGRRPSVFALADRILDRKKPFECPVDGDFALAAVSIPAIIDPYAPWNPTSEELVELNALILKSFEKAFELILPDGGLTTTGQGFRYELPCPEDDREKQTSFSQNAKGVFVFKLIEDELQNHSLPEIRATANQLSEVRSIWVDVLGSKLEKDAFSSRDSRPYDAISRESVAFGRAALGPFWQPQTQNATILDDLSMDRLSREFANLSIEGQAYYILARLEEPDGRLHPDVAIALQDWTDLLRITGRTAYISSSEGATSAASDLSNALVFLAMVRAGESGQLLPKLGSYIASPPSNSFGFRSYLTYDQLVTMAALVEYDVLQGSASPDLEFEAVSGNVTLLSASFTNGTSTIASARVPWDVLPVDPEPIEVSAVGSGEASVAITLNFVPEDLLPFPTYNGIFVERSIQLEDAEDGPGLAKVPAGTVVSVKVQFLTPDALGETVVRVLMPAGLEPVDPNISGGGSFCPLPFFDLFSSYFVNCPTQRTQPTVVSFTFDSVPSGTSSVSFRAVAATSGVFALPPTRVYAVDQPEVMGLSSAGLFEICSGEKCEPTFAEPDPSPVSCPDDCNHSGSCNVRDGTCVCYQGFSGESCAIVDES